MAEAVLFDLASLPSDSPMPLLTRRRVMGERCMLSAVTLEPGFVLGSHSHENEQMVVMLSGRCVFGLGAPGTPEHREVEVAGGQVLLLPSNVPHSCRAVERTSILDVFSPPSAMTGVDHPRG